MGLLRIGVEACHGEACFVKRPCQRQPHIAKPDNADAGLAVPEPPQQCVEHGRARLRHSFAHEKIASIAVPGRTSPSLGFASRCSGPSLRSPITPRPARFERGKQHLGEDHADSPRLVATFGEDGDCDEEVGGVGQGMFGGMREGECRSLTRSRRRCNPDGRIVMVGQADSQQQVVGANDRDISLRYVCGRTTSVTAATELCQAIEQVGGDPRSRSISDDVDGIGAAQHLDRLRQSGRVDTLLWVKEELVEGDEGGAPGTPSSRVAA